MDNILEVSKLRKEYKEFKLKDVSFNLKRGYIMGLIGPNGAGKSTVMKSIMNLINYDSGEIKIFGLDYKANEEQIKNKIGYVGEQQFFYQDMSVKWTEKFFSQYYKKWNNEKFNSLIEKFEVSRTKKIKELSKGMRVKLTIALALAHEPELLLLDEPTSGVDPVIRSEILDILLQFIQDEKKSILLSSHITEDIEKIADYVTYIVNGKILLAAEKEKLLSTWKRVHIKKDAVSDDIRKYLKETEENYFGISGVTDSLDKLQEYTKKMNIKDAIRVENTSLDDILISLVKEGK